MTESKPKNIAIIFQPDTIAFIDEAASAKGQNRSDFIRDAVIAAARATLGKAPPEVPLILKGRRDAISLAAAAQGLTREAFFRKIALEHLESERKDA